MSPTRIQSNRQTLISIAAFFSLSLFTYFFLSDGDFSFLLTYSAFSRTFGFSLLNLKMLSSRSASGVSVKSLEAYCFVFISRLISICRHQGYLPFDRSGDWFYHLVELLSFVLVILAIYITLKKFPGTYDATFDAFGNFKIPSQYGAAYAIIPCFLFAMIFHPNLNRDWISDVLWTFSMYLETAAIVPQLFMFQRQSSGIVEDLISHFVFTLGFARVVEMIFWMSSYVELTGNYGRLAGILVLLSQFFHIVIMGDFFFFYFVSLRRGLPLQLPSQAV